MTASTTPSTGSALPCVKARRTRERAGAAPIVSAVVIAVAGAETGAYAMGDLGELGRLAEIERAVGWQMGLDHIDDAARARTHHDDARREEHRLGNGVRDEDDGLP